MKQAKWLEELKQKWQAEARYFGRVYELDIVTVALGRMGWGPKRFRELDAMLTKVTEEYAADILEDAKSDKDLWHYKDSLDREIKPYVGAMFVPYEERYRFY